MKRNRSNTYYSRRLPHYQPQDATFHVVFRLAGSLPHCVVEQLMSERKRQEKWIAGVIDVKRRNEEYKNYQIKYFEKFDEILDLSKAGPHWLKKSAIAQNVAEGIHFRDNRVYDLLVYCIMPNHVHMVIHLAESVQRNVISVVQDSSILKATYRPAGQQNPASHRQLLAG